LLRVDRRPQLDVLEKNGLLRRRGQRLRRRHRVGRMQDVGQRANRAARKGEETDRAAFERSDGDFTRRKSALHQLHVGVPGQIGIVSSRTEETERKVAKIAKGRKEKSRAANHKIFANLCVLRVFALSPSLDQGVKSLSRSTVRQNSAMRRDAFS